MQVPTTVLAQVDSSIGGKTAVNVRAMKNLVGTFYPPRLVLADPEVLTSLDERSFRSGFFEVVKHAMLSGPSFFRELEKQASQLLPAQGASLEKILARAAEVKVEVVSRDEQESDLRRILNLGHTFGHALEEASGYRRFLHGEAVGWGILIVSRLAELLKSSIPLKGSESPASSGRLARCLPFEGFRRAVFWRFCLKIRRQWEGESIGLFLNESAKSGSPIRSP